MREGSDRELLPTYRTSPLESTITGVMAASQAMRRALSPVTSGPQSSQGRAWLQAQGRELADQHQVWLLAALLGQIARLQAAPGHLHDGVGTALNHPTKQASWGPRWKMGVR